jgi:protocadherin Fat 4
MAGSAGTLEPRVLPAITFPVTFNDPTGAESGYYAELTQLVQAAGASWGQYLVGSASLEVSVDFANPIPNLPGAIAAATAAKNVYLRTQNGIDVYQQGTISEIVTGVDPNGSTADINITINTGLLTAGDLWLDPTPYDDVEPVPSDEYDMFSVLAHELGHGLGFNGFTSSTNGALSGNFETTFDQFVSFDGTNLYFNGPKAEQNYGGPVPLTFGDNFHVGNVAPRPGSALLTDLMNPYGIMGVRIRPSMLDLAILGDAEVNIDTVNGAPTAVTLTNTVPTLPENTSTTSDIKMADISVTDDNLGKDVLSLSGADASFFEIIGGSLYLKAGVSLDFETKSTYTVNVNVDDSTVGASPDASKTFTLTLTDVNEAPTAVTFTNAVTSLPENTLTATHIKLANVGVTDDALGTNTLSLSGTNASSFELIGGVLYLKAGAVLNFEAKSSYQVTVNVDDTTVGVTPDASKNFTLTVTDVNEAPTAVTLTNLVTTLPENTDTTTRIRMADISITDDALGTNITSLSGTDAASFEILNGSLYLRAGVSLNFEAKSSYDVTVNVDDRSVGSTPDVSKTFSLAVSDVNEAPTAVVLMNTITTLPENRNTASHIKLADILITDDALGANVLSLSGPDAASFEIINSVLYLKAGTALSLQSKPLYNIAINVDDSSVGLTPDATLAYSLVISVANFAPTAVTVNPSTGGSLAENTNTSTHVKVGDVVVTDDGLGINTLSLSGPDASSFELVGNALYVRAGVALNFEAKAAYQITVDVDDDTLGSDPDVSGNFTLLVNDVDEAPTALALTNTVPTLPENSDTSNRVPVANVVITDDALGTNVVSLSGPDANSFDVFNGVLYLRAGTNLDFETKASYQVTVNVDDSSVGTSPDLSTNFTLAVTDVNESPTALTITTTISTLPENVNTVSRIRLANISYSDDALGTNVVSLSGPDAASFEVLSGGLYLKAGTSLNFEAKSTYQINVNVDDSSVGSTPDLSQVFTLNLTDVNEAPTNIALSSSSVPENLPISTIVGAFSSTDPDIGATATYSLVSGAGSTDNSSFTIVDGNLQTTNSFDFETKNTYSIRVQATDQGGLSFSKQLTIHVTNVNENPTDLSLSKLSIPENRPSGTAVGTFKTTDIDTGDTFTYTLVAGAGDTDNSSFTILNGQLQSTASFDFEAKSSYFIRVRTTDQGGLTLEKQLQINVTDVNERPTDIALSASSVNENQPGGTVVGTLSSTDPDVAGSFTYALVAGVGSTNNASFNIVNGQLQTLDRFDFETQNSYSIRVQTVDNGGLVFEKQFTISVKDVNEAPNSIKLSQTSVDENSPIGTYVGTFSGTDPDAGNTLHYTLASGVGSTDNSQFMIVGGQLQTAASFDFETKSSYAIRVRATDQSGLTFDQQMTIGVNDINEAPTNITLSQTSIAENLPNGSVVGIVSSTDPDSGNTDSYSLVNGAGSDDNASFAIVNGQLRTTSSFDFEAQPSYTIRVRSTDQDGLTFEKQFTINVTDVNESPVISNITDQLIQEDVTTGTLHFSIQDPESLPSALTVSVTSSNPALIPNSNLVLSGTGTSRGITVTPLHDQNGQTTITVVLSDGVNAVSTSFVVTVAAVDDAPTMDVIAPRTILEDKSTGLVNFTVADVDSAVTDLVVTATSSDTSVVPNGNIVIGGSGAYRTLIITPAANQNGPVTITIALSDGTLVTTQTFLVTVQPVDDPAVITLNSTPLVLGVSTKKAVAIDTTATITDPDTPNLIFSGATLQVSGQTSKDTLSILNQGGISRKGTNVLSGNTVIGAVSGGKKGAPLTIVFSGAATQESVDALMRSIAFKPAAKSTGTRTIRMQMSNIGHASTNQATRQIKIGQ